MRWTIPILLTIIFISISTARATTLVNINTADAATLDALPYISATVAQNIIDYRTAHGPFATIEDIQNVSGIKAGIFTDIEPYITVGDAGTTDNTSSSDISSTTSSQTESSASSITTSSTPTPPSALTITISSDPTAFIDVPISFSASVTTKSGVTDPSARVLWSFGDGSSTEGRTVGKTYRYAGTYLVTATAADGSVMARDSAVITVSAAGIRITAISGDGVTIANDTDERLDLSGWRLTVGASIFRFAQGTMLLPHASVLFPFTIMNVPIAYTASLYYPDGTLAAQFPQVATPVVQPSSNTASSLSLHTVDTVDSTTITAHTNAYDTTTVNAPAAADTTAAAGAALAQPTMTASSTNQTADTPPAVSTSATGGIFRSPWTYGLLGVIALAGGAFILL